jgi:hypothetical protein
MSRMRRDGMCAEGGQAGSRYSITSSASASTVTEMSSPIALAVLRLMVRLYLVGCWNGRSLGFSPQNTVDVGSGAAEYVDTIRVVRD